MCFDDDSHPPIPLSANSSARGETISLTAADGARFDAYLATPGDAPHAQVVILPDVRGLHRFYEELALRFADVGVRALAIDYFGRTAADEGRGESFEYGPHVVQMSQQTFGADLDAAVQYVRENDGAHLPIFAIGFCMGGSLSFWAGVREQGLAGVVGFYAGLTRTRGAVTPVVDWANEIKAPVLGLFGGADEGIPADAIAEFERGLQAGSVEHEVIVYPGAPHSFFDRKAADYARESADAWTRIQGFIADHSKQRV